MNTKFIKRTGIFSFLFFISILFAAAAVAGAAGLDEGEINTTVQGTVYFEKRSTIVPFTVCESDKPCYEPAPYWALMIKSDEGHYEVNRAFAIGSKAKPEVIEVSGVLVRSGSLVRVEGRIRPITEDYAIVSDVKNLVLVNEENPSPVPPSMFGIYYSGWTCSGGVNQPQQRDLFVQVRYVKSPEPDGEGFQMRLAALGSRGHELEEIAVFEKMESAITQRNVSYRGSAGQLTAKLRIRHSEEALINFPSSLLLRHTDGTGPVERIIPMNCTPTRHR